ncbi:hypothetical protein [Noviherbaspirillum cavernae]|uniref:hypothetical protein n=1 Tax=Noviherbaspirillum cavernae TaxID=2320862 RepID=UPI0011C4527D|nr:hypothetical protein [Noviherbaspirillum cavernae]
MQSAPGLIAVAATSLQPSPKWNFAFPPLSDENPHRNTHRFELNVLVAHLLSVACAEIAAAAREIIGRRGSLRGCGASGFPLAK